MSCFTYIYLAFEKTSPKCYGSTPCRCMGCWKRTIWYFLVNWYESKPKGFAASLLDWDEHCVHDDFPRHNWSSLLTLSPFFLWFFHHPACQEEDWPAEREEPHGAVGHTASHEAQLVQSRGVGGWERNCDSKNTVELLATARHMRPKVADNVSRTVSVSVTRGKIQFAEIIILKDIYRYTVPM